MKESCPFICSFIPCIFPECRICAKDCGRHWDNPGKPGMVPATRNLSAVQEGDREVTGTFGECLRWVWAPQPVPGIAHVVKYLLPVCQACDLETCSRDTSRRFSSGGTGYGKYIPQVNIQINVLTCRRILEQKYISHHDDPKSETCTSLKNVDNLTLILQNANYQRSQVS